MNKKPLSILIGALLAAGLIACTGLPSQPPLSTAPTATLAQPADGAHKPATAGAKPRLQDDFYGHINHDYLTETKLPADKAEVNNMTVLNDQAEETLKAILADLGKNYASLKAGSDEKKVIDFYNMALDFKTRDQLGFKPIQPYLDEIKAAQDWQTFNAVTSKQFLLGYTPTVSLGVEQDAKDSSIHILEIGTPDIGLEKQYLEGEDELSQKIRTAYHAYMQDLFMLSGYGAEEAKRKADSVMALEKKLAAAQLAPEDKQDQNKLYNVMTLAALERLTAHTAYIATLKANGLDKASKIVVKEPAALQKLSELSTPENLDAFKSQAELGIIKANSAYLSKKVIEAGAKYLAAYIGIEHVDPDEKLAYAVTNSKFGELLGKVYVEKAFSPQTKADVLAMADAIRDTYARRINALDWLSDETKARALKKLGTLAIKIGYPDKWKDYPGLVVKPYAEGGNLVEAVNAINAIETRRILGKLNQPTNRDEWYMTPQTVNAYYSPMTNEIVFPAAILQPPFYSPKATRAENLGGIGTVIGHEMSHAFDSTGAQFDEKGNLNNWWTKADLRRFQEKVKQAAAIYSAIEVAPGHHVNGDISTGEIMADLGGLTVALDIAEKENLDTKQVFESYAKVWRNVITPEALIAGLTDEHPPGKYRINNIVNLMDKFYADYGIQPGDKMYVAPEKRLKVW
ncbi:MAG: M13 family metallopeptidase [Comamonadaceae bacterium]|nr:M13 family metallopeptidase [Comamonadaceae bacterium]